jgi:cellulose biosynthesis protein BcsQ
MGTFDVDMSSPPGSSHTRSADGPVVGPVVAISSNKGGVGKTTLATNLAIYVRALREDLPVLVVGLDDQRILDRMFALGMPGPGEGNLKHGWAERTLSEVIQLGEYGVHYVPSPPDVAPLKGRSEDPRTLRRILERTEWPGLVVLDTKSDLEALTVNAHHAADRILVPVSDWASLEEAGKLLRMLDRAGMDVERARVVFTLVDRRTRVVDSDTHLFRRLHDEVAARGWPYYKTYLSRSPRVETLNSAGRRPLSILHHARGTAVHAQMRELALELLQDLGISDRLVLPPQGDADELWSAPSPPRGPEPPAPSWTAGLLRSLRRP